MTLALALVALVPLASQVAAAAPQSIPLAEPAPTPGAMFEAVAPERSGIDFDDPFDWEGPQRHLYRHGFAGGGVCVGDYDGDGRPDVYFTVQTGPDRLYRQVGDFEFEDATESAGLILDATRGAGAVFADVDDDGDLDLYVCNYDAPNRLYVNDGDGTFTEGAQAAGLDFAGASIMAGFADYDVDGDLDLFLLTNRLYPGPLLDVPRTAHVRGRVVVDPQQEEAFRIQERRIDGEVQKFVVKAGQRDLLFRNDGTGRFDEVSTQAGISGNHAGLSATWWDYDHDGLPDLYVANDFWDADRLYHNEGDGRFRDVIAEALPHTPWFSMGSDFADVDNDGLVDFLAADMSATTHFMSKLMMGDMGDSRWFLESAEPRQYMRNALYLNTGTERFMEGAALAGIASTDWTWSVKFGDLDCDGRVDLYVTNGSANHSFDPDLTRKLREVSERQTAEGITDPAVRAEEQWQLYRELGVRHEANLAFRNTGDLKFENSSRLWGLANEQMSMGAALADLDRDGDLDVLVNDVGAGASVYRNGAVDGHRLLVQLRGTASNSWGLGAIVEVDTEDGTQVRQLAPTRGYMSANEPVLHFGLGRSERVRELRVQWPSGSTSTARDLSADILITVTEPEATEESLPQAAPPPPLLREVALDRGLDSGPRVERHFDDYAEQPLLPARLSQRGPCLAWGDADSDGDDDLYVGGSAGYAGQLWLYDDGDFAPAAWSVDAEHEDTAALWLDADSDGDLDLYVASGSNEFGERAPQLRDRLYLNDGAGGLERAPEGSLPDVRDDVGALVAADFDQDGDLDLFVGARAVPGKYPVTPTSRLLRNDGGRFVDATAEVAPGLESVGLVTAALWSDADLDGDQDLLVATEWGPVHYWSNDGGRLVSATETAGLAGRLGWWTSVTSGDFDSDGDSDYVVLNAGLNTKYGTNEQHLFYGAFEGEEHARIVEAKPGSDDLLPVRGLSCSSNAMPAMKDEIPTYRQFASSTLEEIYGAEPLSEALELAANHLESGLLFNVTEPGGPARFEYRALPRVAQISPGYGAVTADFDLDGNLDLAIAQNFFGREPETGHWDGGVGLILLGDGSGGLIPQRADASGFVVPGDATAMTAYGAGVDGQVTLVVAQNEGRVLGFSPGRESTGPSLTVRVQGPPGNVNGVGTRVTLIHPGERRTSGEVHAGSGHGSQSQPLVFFGLPGEWTRPDGPRIVVRWPNGTTMERQVPSGVGLLTIGYP